MTDFYTRKTCRLCDAPIQVALELPPTPPANELVTREFVDSRQVQDTFPLPVAVCMKCGHVQLACVVKQERLFRSTPYRSGASPVYRQHLRDYARDLMCHFGTPKFLLEIGSNDGTFLNFFVGPGAVPFGELVLGVEPDSKCCDFAAFDGLSTVQGMFSRTMAAEIRARYGTPDLIVANHVFAHIDNLRDVALGVKELLSWDGVFVFEVGYLMDVLKNTLFDVIYHEHLSYHHLSPLIPFFDSLGLSLYDAERVDTQGGAIRCYVMHGSRGMSMRLQDLILKEPPSPLSVSIHLSEMGGRIEVIRNDLCGMLQSLKRDGARMVGYGAPAKCCTLMHTLGFGPDVLDFIVDDNPVKHGLFTPGKHVEIRPVTALYEYKPDYVLVLAWNFAKSIVKSHPKFRYIVPISFGQSFSDGDYVVVCGRP